MTTVKLTIDGREVEVPQGSTVLQAARKIGIDVPTLCYDERLTPHGGCRMCIVEVEQMPNKLVSSCSTPATEGMVVHTETEKIVEARREILNLLLSDHPLDCLTCEKNGDCKLQEYCYRYDVKESTFTGEMSQYEKDISSPFFERDANKCILCHRCVRVCHELMGVGAISVAQRGFKAHVTPAFDVSMEESPCVSCGNCVAVCPVGALKPKSEIKFRSWEVEKVKTTCSYCGVGCQLNLLVKGDKVVGVEPFEGSGPNNGMLCVKGRFGYNFINHQDRLKKPMIKKDGLFVESEWDEALDLVANKINEIKGGYGADAIAGLASARCTNEENYLMQKLMRGVIGTDNIDHCARL